MILLFHLGFFSIKKMHIYFQCMSHLSTETNLYTRPSSHQKMVKLNVGTAIRKVCFSVFVISTACYWTSGFHTELGINIQSSPAH